MAEPGEFTKRAFLNGRIDLSQAEAVIDVINAKTKIETKEEIIIYAKKLQEKGAQNVLISLGGDGAILLTEKNEVYYSNTPKGQVINTVGAGDSMVAGFVAGYLKKKDYKESLKLGIASGSATAFSAGLAMNEEINGLLKQITIEKI